jgi:Ca2+-binding EF-hand superfamily protein
MWEKIKKWFGFLDLNKDGKVTAEDLEVARAIADKKAKEANETINAVVEAAEKIKKVRKKK